VVASIADFGQTTAVVSSRPGSSSRQRTLARRFRETDERREEDGGVRWPTQTARLALPR